MQKKSGIQFCMLRRAKEGYLIEINLYPDEFHINIYSKSNKWKWITEKSKSTTTYDNWESELKKINKEYILLKRKNKNLTKHI